MVRQKIFVIGECMIELSNINKNIYNQSVAGDTLNFCSYLNNNFFYIEYLTALGKSKINRQILKFIKEKKISTKHINNSNKFETGLYLIQNDKKGEKQFYYWRDQSAAKNFFKKINFFKYYNVAKDFQYIYFTGITLSIFDINKIEQFSKFLNKVRKNNVKIIFDLNIRVNRWKKNELNKSLKLILPKIDILFASGEDIFLWKQKSSIVFFQETLKKYNIKHGIFRKNAKFNYAFYKGKKYFNKNKIKTNIIDSSGAGDGYNAAYFSKFIETRNPKLSLRSGSDLGSKIIMQKGSIIN